MRIFHILFHMYFDDTQVYKSVDSSDFKKKLQNNSISVTSEISNWISHKSLKLNEERTEFLITGMGRENSKGIDESLNVVGIDIKPSTSVKNLGVIIHQDISLN